MGVMGVEAMADGELRLGAAAPEGAGTATGADDVGAAPLATLRLKTPGREEK